MVARLRRIGVVTTNKALSSLEHGAGLDVCKLPEIARALDCSLTYLVGLTDDPKRWEPDGTELADRRRERRRSGRRTVRPRCRRSWDRWCEPGARRPARTDYPGGER